MRSQSHAIRVAHFGSFSDHSDAIPARRFQLVQERVGKLQTSKTTLQQRFGVNGGWDY